MYDMYVYVLMYLIKYLPTGTILVPIEPHQQNTVFNDVSEMLS